MLKDKRYGVNTRSKGLIPIPSGEVPAGLRCVEIQIPDSDDGLRQLFGALYELTHWQNFDREAEHKGTLWARAWKTAITASMPPSDCGGETMPQTLIEYNTPCGLRWSYDDGETWTDADLSDCAVQVIGDNILFTVTDDILQVSLDGGLSWENIYDAKLIADQEIIGQIFFQVDDNNLQVSLDGGETYTTIYDAATIATEIADQEIQARVIFSQDGLNLKATTTGLGENNENLQVIYDPESEIRAIMAEESVIPIPWHTRVQDEQILFHLVCRSNGHVVLPVMIAAGDTIQVSNLRGAWSSDAMNTVSGEYEAVWFTPTGYYYSETPGGTPTNDIRFGVPLMTLVARRSGDDGLISVYDGNQHTIDVIGVAGHGHVWFFPAQWPLDENDGEHQNDASGYAAFDVLVRSIGEPGWIESFQIDANNANARATEHYCYSGKTYRVTFDGTWIVGVGGWGSIIGDGFYRQNTGPSDWTATDVVMGVNGSRYSPAPSYDGSHEYTFDMEGNDGYIAFKCLDGNYSDNSGQITVTVEELV